MLLYIITIMSKNQSSNQLREVNHGNTCDPKGNVAISLTKKGKYEPVICKKSRQIFGRKYKSTLKKK